MGVSEDPTPGQRAAGLKSGDAAPGARTGGLLAERLSHPRGAPGLARAIGAGPFGLSGAEIAAALAAVIWLVVATLILVFARSGAQTGDGAGSPDSMSFVLTLLAVFLPVALIWVAASSARAQRTMRDEGRRLRLLADQLHEALAGVQAGVQAPAQSADPEFEARLDEILRAQRKTEAALTALIAARASEAASAVSPARAALPEAGPETAPEAPSDQASLALEGPGAEAPAGPLPPHVLISALNFPENPDDTEGFRALRRALQHRPTGLLVQASQDVLTLLSQDGVYMDDLIPERARPELWRRFAEGERGGAVGPLGGIRDRAALSVAATRMRQDAIFRDAAHHFLRRFDQMLTAFGPGASDADLSALADTRTARAFMLLGRVTGAFD